MVAEQETQANEAGDQENFVLQRIYIKDLSYEAPGVPETFTREWQPKMSVQINSNHTKLDDANYEVVITVTVSTEDDAGAIYVIEIQQAGLFLDTGMEGERLEKVLGAFCPSVLFPYAREAVSDIITRGGFPQMLLAPVNFDALFAETQRRKQEQAEKEAGESSQH